MECMVCVEFELPVVRRVFCTVYPTGERRKGCPDVSGEVESGIMRICFRRGNIDMDDLLAGVMIPVERTELDRIIPYGDDQVSPVESAGDIISSTEVPRWR